MTQFINFNELKERSVLRCGYSGTSRYRARLNRARLPDIPKNRICGFTLCDTEEATQKFVSKIESLGGTVWFRNHCEEMNVTDTVRIGGNSRTDWYQILLYVTSGFKPDEIVDQPDYIEFWWD